MYCGHVQEYSYFLCLEYLREFSYFWEMHTELFKDEGTSYKKQTVQKRERQWNKCSKMLSFGGSG